MEPNALSSELDETEIIKPETSELIFYRGVAYEHKNGDVYTVVASIYNYPLEKRPTLIAVGLERTRDKRIFERTVEVLKAQIDAGSLFENPRFNDKRMNYRKEISANRLIIKTIDDDGEGKEKGS